MSRADLKNVVLFACLVLAACAPAAKRELGVADFAPPGGQQVTARPPALTVFFDLDSARITPDAAATLDRLIKEHRRIRHARVLLAGHSDRSGPERRNLGLSGERAVAVHDYLLRSGVPVEIVSTEALGEKQGMVATPDGVAEPQNRRVEIYIEPRT